MTTLCWRWKAGLGKRWMHCGREGRGRETVEGGAGGGGLRGRELPFLENTCFEDVVKKWETLRGLFDGKASRPSTQVLYHKRQSVTYDTLKLFNKFLRESDHRKYVSYAKVHKR